MIPGGYVLSSTGPERFVTSQCMAINDFTCADCAAPYCTHECHLEVKEFTS